MTTIVLRRVPSVLVNDLRLFHVHGCRPVSPSLPAPRSPLCDLVNGGGFFRAGGGTGFSLAFGRSLAHTFTFPSIACHKMAWDAMRELATPRTAIG